jgi:hypothetical protein
MLYITLAKAPQQKFELFCAIHTAAEHPLVRFFRLFR